MRPSRVSRAFQFSYASRADGREDIMWTKVKARRKGHFFNKKVEPGE
jgi:hypothetical protein